MSSSKEMGVSVGIKHKKINVSNPRSQQGDWSHEAYLLFPVHLDGTLFNNANIMQSRKEFYSTTDILQIFRQVRFIIMGNLFCSEYSIHRCFNLKGSCLRRTTDKPQTEIDQYTTLKDLDLNFIFRLKNQRFQEFQRQVDRDCDFLEQEKIMDYSLLVGVHFRDNREMLLPEGFIDYDINSNLQIFYASKLAPISWFQTFQRFHTESISKRHGRHLKAH